MNMKIHFVAKSMDSSPRNQVGIVVIQLYELVLHVHFAILVFQSVNNCTCTVMAVMFNLYSGTLQRV